MTENAAFARNRTTRNVLRVLGIVLLAVGLYLVITGGKAFLDEMDSGSTDSGPGSILRLGAGGFLCVFGLGALNAGFLGAQARYAAGETMPVVKDSAEYLSDGEGVLGIGRAAGPFCSKCGVRNDGNARFCDGCGAQLA
jgi:hypothetical protein